jgi:hypothetical protein
MMVQEDQIYVGMVLLIFLHQINIRIFLMVAARVLSLQYLYGLLRLR